MRNRAIDDYLAEIAVEHSDKLNWINLSGLTDADVRRMISHLAEPNRVRVLYTGLQRQISDEGVKAIAQGLPHLTDLDLQMCDEISDQGFKAIAQGLPKLAYLDLLGCAISDEGMKAVAQGLPPARSLGFDVLPTRQRRKCEGNRRKSPQPHILDRSYAVGVSQAKRGLWSTAARRLS